MQSAQAGHFSLTIDGKTFNLSPSLRNMAKIADSKRVLVLYEMIHSPKIPDWLRLTVGREILLACCDSEDLDRYLIKCFKQKPRLNNHQISINDQVQVAAALMRHGIAGVNKTEYEGSKKNNKKADSFDINKIVADCMIHFGLSKSESLDLTMTEFSYLLASKFPVDNSKKQSVPSLEDHKAVMEELNRQNKAVK